MNPGQNLSAISEEIVNAAHAFEISAKNSKWSECSVMLNDFAQMIYKCGIYLEGIEPRYSQQLFSQIVAHVTGKETLAARQRTLTDLSRSGSVILQPAPPPPPRPAEVCRPTKAQASSIQTPQQPKTME